MKRKTQNESNFWSQVGWWIYPLTVRIHNLFPQKKRQTKMTNRRLKDGLFVYGMLLFPLVQFAVFYIGVNVNSVLMAFQSYEEGRYVFSGWANFQQIFQVFFKDDQFVYCVKNSLQSFLVIQILSPVVLFFTYFIYKKFVGYKFFKIVLFLPTIISTVITVTIYKYFLERAIPMIWEKVFNISLPGLLSSRETAFGSVMFYYLWLSFGSLMLMYLGAMNGISESVVEAAKIEGATVLQEFVYITFPMIWPTFSTLFYTSIAGIFVNQINLFSLWGTEAERYLWTFGYYLYREVSLATNAEYPYLAALGLLMTVVAAPVTFFVKWSVQRIGPKTE